MTDTPLAGIETWEPWPARAGRSSPTLKEARHWLQRLLAKAGVPDPSTDARRLLTELAGVRAEELISDPSRPIDAATWSEIARAGQRRAAREPLSRILGRRAFHNLVLEIGPSTLDPRPETETVVEAALALLATRPPPPYGQPIRLLDIGTGSGAIALALLVSLPSATAVATDLCLEALAIARRNACRLGVADRITFIATNWVEGIEGPFELIVSNPPYIPTAVIDRLEPEVRLFDPLAALDGGPDGLTAYRALAPSLNHLLAPGGFVVLEVGHDQADEVARVLAREGLSLVGNSDAIDRDLSGYRRCVVANTA